MNSTLKEFGESLRTSGVDPYLCYNVATAMLGIAHEKEWITHPERMAAWLQEVAVEVGRHWNEHEPTAFEEPTFASKRAAKPRPNPATTENRGPSVMWTERAGVFDERTNGQEPEANRPLPRYVATY